MKSVRQNVILESTDQHKITLIKSEQQFTTAQRKLCQPASNGYKNRSKSW